MQRDTADPFERLSGVLKSDRWKPVSDIDLEPGSSASFVITDKHTCLVKCECDIPIPLWYYEAVWRPEFQCLSGDSREVCEAECELVERLAPGDTFLWIMLHQRGLNIAFRSTGAASTKSDQDGHILRCVVRRNFPQEGQFTKLLLPDGSSHAQLACSEMLGSITQVLQPAKDPNWTHFSHMTEYPWPEFPLFAVPQLKMILDIGARFGMVHRDLPYAAAATNFYVTLTLKNCPRGHPLVPTTSKAASAVQSGKFYWKVDSGSSFKLADYLNRLLDLASLTCRAFGSLDGQLLVPYQAVMERSDWEKVHVVLEDLMGSQRTAYRMLNGGTIAPKLRLARETHFVSEFAKIHLFSTQAPGLVVKNTFVDVPSATKDVDAPPSFRRAVECP